MVCASPLFAADKIQPIHQNGRTIYVNKEEPRGNSAVAPEFAPIRHYVYWSNTQHRWKNVPTPSRRALRNAEVAAREVTSMVADAAAAPNTEATIAASNSMKSSSRRGPLKDLSAQRTLDQIIDDAADRNHVDRDLVRALIQVESNFNPSAISRKGAIGLMQLMPATARDLNVDPYDPEQNVEGGVRHLRGLLDNYKGDVQLSLAAYNAGVANVAKHGGIPPFRETQAYVKKITQLYGPGHPFDGAAGYSPITVGRDSEGHLFFSNQ